MRERFVLINAREMYDIVCNSYFKRYDLTKEWSLLNKQINNYKSKIRREPFMYDLIDILLMILEDSMKKQVKNVLSSKDKEWFFKIGQYFFYNTYQWIKNFNYGIDGALEKNQSLKIFLKIWWSKFLEFENNLVGFVE